MAVLPRRSHDIYRANEVLLEKLTGDFSRLHGDYFSDDNAMASCVVAEQKRVMVANELAHSKLKAQTLLGAMHALSLPENLEWDCLVKQHIPYYENMDDELGKKSSGWFFMLNYAIRTGNGYRSLPYGSPKYFVNINGVMQPMNMTQKDCLTRATASVCIELNRKNQARVLGLDNACLEDPVAAKVVALDKIHEAIMDKLNSNYEGHGLEGLEPVASVESRVNRQGNTLVIQDLAVTIPRGLNIPNHLLHESKPCTANRYIRFICNTLTRLRANFIWFFNLFAVRIRPHLVNKPQDYELTRLLPSDNQSLSKRRRRWWSHYILQSSNVCWDTPAYISRMSFMNFCSNIVLLACFALSSVALLAEPWSFRPKVKASILLTSSIYALFYAIYRYCSHRILSPLRFGRHHDTLLMQPTKSDGLFPRPSIRENCVRFWNRWPCLRPKPRETSYSGVEITVRPATL